MGLSNIQRIIGGVVVAGFIVFAVSLALDDLKNSKTAKNDQTTTIEAPVESMPAAK
ncbi:MAG: hypothetical protein HQL71_04175 [Magnetococcales bacterium]|nr:hypothetical protein [Magnetococcales bacterium]